MCSSDLGGLDRGATTVAARDGKAAAARMTMAACGLQTRPLRGSSLGGEEPRLLGSAHRTTGDLLRLTLDYVEGEVGHPHVDVRPAIKDVITGVPLEIDDPRSRSGRQRRECPLMLIHDLLRKDKGRTFASCSLFIASQEIPQPSS